jgi:hypothetical protein
MANQKKTSPVVWAGLLAVCAAIYFNVDGGASSAAANPKRKPPAPATKKDDFTPADYTAKFDALEAKTATNAFNPLVVRSQGKNSVPTIDGAIPAAFADGDGNWQYKGYATVDGTANALLENQNSGEGVFVKPGERWKSCRVLTITRDSVVMQGTSGAARTIPIVSEDQPVSRTASTSLTPLPVPNPITGAISDPAQTGGGRGGRRNRFGGFGNGNPGSIPSGSAPAAPAPAGVQFSSPGIVIGQ